MKYRFKVTSKNDQSVLGTGSFLSSEKMNNEQKLDFFHQFTSGRHLKKEHFETIVIEEEIDVSMPHPLVNSSGFSIVCNGCNYMQCVNCAAK